jgi:hypothetical protein
MADLARLETRLRALAAESEFAPTPELAPRVAGALRSATPSARAPQAAARRRRLVLALVAAALLLPAAAIAAVPSTRDAVLDWLGLRGVSVHRVSRPPRPGPSAGLHLGTPTRLAEARVRFRPLVPRALGRPAGVFRAGSPPGGRVSLTYRPRAGLPAVAPGVGALITEFRGSRTREFIQKALGPGTTARRVSVGGDPGVYLSGRPHGFVFIDAAGQIRMENVRLARDVLLWEHDGLVLRLEARLPLRRLLATARSFG